MTCGFASSCPSVSASVSKADGETDIEPDIEADGEADRRIVHKSHGPEPVIVAMASSARVPSALTDARCHPPVQTGGMRTADGDAFLAERRPRPTLRSGGTADDRKDLLDREYL